MPGIGGGARQGPLGHLAFNESIRHAEVSLGEFLGHCLAGWLGGRLHACPVDPGAFPVQSISSLLGLICVFLLPSGLGYITGSSVKQAAGDWHWALRVRPCSCP
jgi:hypothetical protein